MDTDSKIDPDELRTDASDRLASTGIVMKVWTRTTTDDTGSDAPSNHEASVQLVSGTEEPRRLPIHQDFPGAASVPKPGDFVRIEYLQSEGESAVITGYAHSLQDQNRPAIAREGHWRYRFGNLYVEAEPTGHGNVAAQSDYEVVRLAKKPDGLSDPSTQVAVDDSGGTTEVKIETDGNITISAGGDVVIDEGGTAKKVLTEDAQFEYEQRVDTSDGTGGTQTKTTTKVSNGEKTETEIE